MSAKNTSRLRRARRARARIGELDVHRLCVHRTPRHIYAQVFAPAGQAPSSQVVVSASTLEAELKKDLKSSGNIEAAKRIGNAIAERAQAQGIERVAFDRAGYKYHGRVKALADAARDGGLSF